MIATKAVPESGPSVMKYPSEPGPDVKNESVIAAPSVSDSPKVPVLPPLPPTDTK